MKPQASFGSETTCTAKVARQQNYSLLALLSGIEIVFRPPRPRGQRTRVTLRLLYPVLLPTAYGMYASRNVLICLLLSSISTHQ